MGDIGGRSNLGKRIDSSGRIRDNSPPPALAGLLLVALTVVLFLIAAYTFIILTDSSGTDSKMVNIGTSPTDHGSVILTIFSGDVYRLTSLEVADGGSSGVFQPVVHSDGRKPSTYDLGSYYAFNVASPPADKINSVYTTRVIVRGIFDDGTHQVFVDKIMTFLPPHSQSDIVIYETEDTPAPTQTLAAEATETSVPTSTTSPSRITPMPTLTKSTIVATVPSLAPTKN